MLKNNCWLIILVSSFAFMSEALPKYESTTLPFPKRMDETDKFMAQEVIKLRVFQDSEDENTYYYVPEFHVRQYAHGAADVMLNANNLKSYAGAKYELDNRTKFAEDYSLQKIIQLQEKRDSDEEKTLDALLQLQEATLSGHSDLISLRKILFERRQKTAEESAKKFSEAEESIKRGQTLLPSGLGRGYFERALNHLAGTGLSPELSASEDPESLSSGIKKTLDRLSGSYGGYLSLNIYGGFTKRQVDALIAYKAKYMPHLKIALLPIEKLSFVNLTENQEGDDANKIFRQIKGAGDYLGSVVVMDLSIAGSVSFAEHLRPFILPIGIKATLKQQMKEAEAYLDCDFSNGFELQGRADVRDGLIFFDNDVTNTMKASDINKGACSLKHISGDLDSAQYKAMEEMEKTLESMRMSRIELSRSEKEKYFKGVLADIEANRRKEEPSYTKVIRQFGENGWEEVIVEGLTRAADFHWHTNIQDIANISTVKFRKEISIKGHKTIEKDLPPNLCLVYNQQTKSYDRCLDSEEAEARPLVASMKEAEQSPVCQDTSNPYECGRNRDSAGLTTKRAITAVPDDSMLLSTLE